MITYYAIQHKPTGFYLPASRRRRGFTHDEPIDPEIVPPRLFLKKWNARKALDWWLSGKGESRWSTVAGYGGYEPKEIQHTDVKKVESRRYEEMEVVALYVSETNWWNREITDIKVPNGY